MAVERPTLTRVALPVLLLCPSVSLAHPVHPSTDGAAGALDLMLHVLSSPDHAPLVIAGLVAAVVFATQRRT